MNVAVTVNWTQSQRVIGNFDARAHCVDLRMYPAKWMVNCIVNVKWLFTLSLLCGRWLARAEQKKMLAESLP